jgi:hypothetical protein
MKLLLAAITAGLVATAPPVFAQTTGSDTPAATESTPAPTTTKAKKKVKRTASRSKSKAKAPAASGADSGRPVNEKGEKYQEGVTAK